MPDGQPLRIGANNTGSSTTNLERAEPTNNTAFLVRNQNGIAVQAVTDAGNAIRAINESGPVGVDILTRRGAGISCISESGQTEFARLPALLAQSGDSAAIHATGEPAAEFHGNISVIDSAGRTVFVLTADSATWILGNPGSDGDFECRDLEGRSVLELDGGSASLRLGTQGNAGAFAVQDENGVTRIDLDGTTGDIRLSGADCAEYFHVPESARIEPGMALVVDQEDTLLPCEKPYDRRVVGVVSGAGDLKPGILLDEKYSRHGRQPLSVVGKAYCKVDAQYAPIEVGDLLTTSPTLGHAMRAVDPAKAFGAVIGKALKPLREGTGLIPLIVALQ
jgi:hypothetical protein